jgi:hypothetical protein
MKIMVGLVSGKTAGQGGQVVEGRDVALRKTGWCAFQLSRGQAG